jgi:antitoxin HicB
VAPGALGARELKCYAQISSKSFLRFFDQNQSPKLNKQKIAGTIMKTLNYRIRLLKEEEGGYTVVVPALPGCVTFGETLEEAISMAKEAIEGYIETLRDLGKDVPTDNDVIEYTVSVEAYA